MESITVIFPHQLFKKHPALDPNRPIYLVEEFLFFRQYAFHKQKLVLHRASMKGYEKFLRDKKFRVHYVETIDKENDIRKLVPALAKNGVKEIHYCDTVDDWLEKRLISSSEKAKIKLIKYDSPGYILTLDDVKDFYGTKPKYFLTDFYIWHRKRMKLLLNTENKPEGGKWTYDAENRKKFPSGEKAPKIRLVKQNALVKEARTYVEKNFSENYGDVQSDDPGFYPVTFKTAEAWLDDFLLNRFQHFGVYQDAMVGKENFLHHSVLTPMLNVGLLTSKQIVDKAIQAVEETDIPLNSLEGFIRQIIGWREFIRIIYEREGVFQRTNNYWDFKRKIPESFWTGETGILPVDMVVKKLLKTAYSHHIERLMVIANFMLLCEFDPDEVYKWFMELYIDSYDWVMVPNVYGMTQFADGGLMATKPYISGSNYLLKMSDFKRGPWTEIWDGLFWRFMHEHRDFFEQNQRLGMLLKTFDKMPKEKRNHHLETAEKFLKELDKGKKAQQSKMFD